MLLRGLWDRRCQDPTYLAKKMRAPYCWRLGAHKHVLILEVAVFYNGIANKVSNR